MIKICHNIIVSINLSWQNNHISHVFYLDPYLVTITAYWKIKCWYLAFIVIAKVIYAPVDQKVRKKLGSAECRLAWSWTVSTMCQWSGKHQVPHENDYCWNSDWLQTAPFRLHQSWVWHQVICLLPEVDIDADNFIKHASTSTNHDHPWKPYKPHACKVKRQASSAHYPGYK